MSGGEQVEPEPLVVEVTADTGGFLSAMRRAESDLMFSFHPDLSTPAEREARYAFLRTLGVVEDFRERMNTLITQPGTSAEEVARIRAGVLRLADIEDGEPQA